MFGQLYRTFGSLFPSRGAKTAVLAMILLMAFIPVAELLVIRMFSQLVISGEKEFADDPAGVYQQAAIFFGLFVVTRALGHWSRFARVLAVKRAFRQSDDAGASRAAWEWALAFELSIVYVALIQAAALVSLFVVLDGMVGVVNAGIVVAVLFAIARLYQRNLDKQMSYVRGETPTSNEVGDRVGQRIKDAETGAAISSFAMAFALAAVLYFTLKGGIAGADAVVMLLGMRLLYGQLGQLSSGAMRFGRATARRDGGGGGDPTDEDEMDEQAVQQGFSESKRSDLVMRTLKFGQRGDLTGLDGVREMLREDGDLSEEERRGIHAAEAFAHYARGVGTTPTALLWQIRPFPGVATDWMNPLLLEHVSGAPISYASPPADYPHLVMSGRLGRHVNASSITVGLGALPDDVLDPGATYVSVRGPRTAGLLGTRTVTRYGEPLALAARAIPVRRRPTNGRLALVRHYEHTKFDVRLGDRIDEVGSFGSRPDAIRSFVDDLVSYDGVVTTSLAVMAVCQSFGVPVAPVTFSERSPVQEFAYEDHALGLGLPVVLPTEIAPDLSRTNFDDLLATVTLDPAVLDDIQNALHDAVELFTERYAVLDQAFDEVEVE